MTVNDETLRAFEGLVFRTAQIYERRLRVEREDLQQVLRLKVWMAVRAYDAKKSRTSLESFVFSCVRNQIKDLVKSRIRRDRLGVEHLIDDLFTDDWSRERFEGSYLAAVDEPDEVLIPSTLTANERSMIGLLYVGFKQVEIAEIMEIPRNEVTQRMASIRQKMADWRPGAPAAQGTWKSQVVEIMRLPSDERAEVLL
jgi:RNA polymerase sigma factor (sigma-70 family)